MTFMSLIAKKLRSNTRSKVGAALIMPKLKELKDVFDYTEYGGAPILGIKKPVLKIHGSSNFNAVRSGILRGIPFVEEGVVEHIESSVAAITDAGYAGDTSDISDSPDTEGTGE